jgi:hypothetical protein
VSPELLRANEFVSAISAAAPHSRPVICAQAVITWRRVKPATLSGLVADALLGKLNGLSQRNLADIGALLTADEVAKVLRQLSKPNLPFGVDAMFQDQDAADFLGIIAAVRDGEWNVNGLTPSCDSSLRRAMRVASSASSDHPQMLHYRDADEFMLLVGASRTPRALLHTNVYYSFHYQRAEKFAGFAYGNPFLTDADRRELTRHSHPAAIADAHAAGLLDDASLAQRVNRLIEGSLTEQLLLLAAAPEDVAHVALAEHLVSQHPELLRTALCSDVPTASELATRVVARHVPADQAGLAVALASRSNLALSDLVALCAAVTGRP